ncbi:MAG: hypothetical protein ACPGF8_02345, partial [Opitutales bacterium]
GSIALLADGGSQGTLRRCCFIDSAEISSMHSSTRYLLDDYWSPFSDCVWRYLIEQDTASSDRRSASDRERGEGGEP